MAPYLSARWPAPRRPPRSPLWPRLSRSPLWSRRRLCPRCSRSKYQPVFSRVSDAEIGPPCLPLLRREVPRNGRVDAVFLCCFVLWSSLSSGLRLTQRLLDASFPRGHSRIFFCAFIDTSRRRPIFRHRSRGRPERDRFIRRVRPRVRPEFERGDGNREGEHEDHDAPFGPNEPAKGPRPQDGGVDDDQRAEARPPPDTLHPDAGPAQRQLEGRDLSAPETRFPRSFSAVFNRGRPVLFRRGGRIGRRNRGADGVSAAFADAC